MKRTRRPGASMSRAASGTRTNASYWSGYNPALDFTDVSQTGDLTGIENITQGLGLDVQVYGALRAKHDWQRRRRRRGAQLHRRRQRLLQNDARADRHADGQSGFLRRAAGLRQVNTTRFSLFTPETRDFFLQDVAAFEFGGRNFGRNSQDRVVQQRPAVLLAQYRPRAGRPVSLSSATSCRANMAASISARSRVLTDKTPTGEDGQILSRRARHASDLRRIEVRLHRHQWRSDRSDQEHRRRRRLPVPQFEFPGRQDPPGRRLLHEELLEQSRATTIPRRSRSTSPTSRGSAISSFKQIGESFLPALGFINRTAIRQYVGTVAHLTRYRNMYLNQLEFGTEFRIRHRSRTTGWNRAPTTSICARPRASATRSRSNCINRMRKRAGAVLPAATTCRSLRGTYQWNNFNVARAHLRRAACSGSTRR